jgi:lipopolysaccharide transport system permease protein
MTLMLMPVNSTSPIKLANSLWMHRNLIWQMTRREVIGRYRGSVLGLAWSFFYPLIMLAVFTFVFGVVFKARWGTNIEQSQLDFAIILFIGMTMFNLFSECAVRAPTLIIGNVSYVKKVVFPLEILPVIALGSAFFHWLIGFFVLCLAMLLIKGSIPLTAFFIPLIVMPLAIATLGIAWFLSSLGVFLRDVAQTIGIIISVLQFLSPIFYPISALPEKYQAWLLLNPLTFVIEQSRAVFFWGQAPDWSGLLVYSIACILMAWCGYWWFQKTRKGFADVL